MPSRAPSESPRPNALVRLFVHRIAVRALAFGVLTLAVAAAAVVAASARGPAGPRPVAASTLTVTNTNDDGAGSLRRALADATPGDTVDFNLPRGSTITLTSGELFIGKSLNVSGPGAYELAVSGNGASRVFRIVGGTTVNISGLTIRDGRAGVALCASGDCRGGGILNSGTLTLTHCNVYGNGVGGGVLIAFNGGTAFGGGIENLGALTMAHSVVTGNSAGGAFDFGGSAAIHAFGGGIDNTGTMTLTHCTVSGNGSFGSAGLNGGNGNGGGISNRAGGVMNVTGGAVSFNRAVAGYTSRGVPGGASAGGIHNAGTLTMTDSAVSNNRAEAASSLNAAGGGGIVNGGGFDNSGKLTLTGCVVDDNSALGVDITSGDVEGGGISNRAAGKVTLAYTAVRNNRALAGGLYLGGANDARGGGVYSGGDITLTNSVVSGNSAAGGSGSFVAGSAEGGGVYGGPGTIWMANSTVSGNRVTGGRTLSADGQAGKAAGGGISGGSLSLTNCTITLNTAVRSTGGVEGRDSKGNVYGGGVVSGIAATWLNTIVAGNSVVGNLNPTAASDVSGQIISHGHNLVGKNAGAESSLPAGLPNADHDFVGTHAAPLNPRLGPLSNNGGPTETHRPLAGSPAVDAGAAHILLPPYSLGTDQRGRPRLVGANVDVGAVETATSNVTFQFDAGALNADEGVGQVNIIVTRAAGEASAASSVAYAASEGTASARADFVAARGTLHFAPGETLKSFDFFINNDALTEGDETFTLSLIDPETGALLDGRSTNTVTIRDNDQSPASANPIDDARFFVRQHYVDFLGREADDAGLDFWANQIDACGADAACREGRRVHVSAAFFLSIEFQETGAFATRVRHVAFGERSDVAGSRVTFEEFQSAARQVGEDVVVGRGDWEQRLRQNKQDYLRQLTRGADFAARFPETLGAADYVQALFTSAGVTPTASERQDAVAAFGAGGAEGRAAALGSVADSDSVRASELTAAFALAEYFGYLRRDPTGAPDSNDTGYQFWLTKLNSFGGDYIRAEMVKAFISSAEYRRRFGTQ